MDLSAMNIGILKSDKTINVIRIVYGIGGYNKNGIIKQKDSCSIQLYCTNRNIWEV